MRAPLFFHCTFSSGCAAICSGGGQGDAVIVEVNGG